MVRLLLLALGVLLIAACAGPHGKSSLELNEARPSKPERFDSLAELAKPDLPERNRIREPFRYDRSIGMTPIADVRYFFYHPDDERAVVGFSLQNTGSPTINPAGIKRRGPRREYAFLFADRARENVYLAINDDVKLSGRFSHDNMFRELHFFPRQRLPAMTVDHATGVLTVTLPTGETAHFDQNTKELVGGALIEAPIDFNRSRHQRRNPAVRYRGDYLAITVAQRGEAPRRARVWGQTKFAEVHYPSRYKTTCRISPKHLWDQNPKPGDNDPTLNMLHRSDAEVFAVIERQCGWNLAAIRNTVPSLAEAE